MGHCFAAFSAPAESSAQAASPAAANELPLPGMIAFCPTDSWHSGLSDHDNTEGREFYGNALVTTTGRDARVFWVQTQWYWDDDGHWYFEAFEAPGVGFGASDVRFEFRL